MPFDLKRFAATEFRDRISEVPVPGLSEWYGPGEPTLWIVRGLTAPELARANAAVDNLQSTQKMVEGLAGGNEEKANAILSALGVSDDPQPEFVKRLEWLIIASVDPKIDREQGLRLGINKPAEFQILTKTIERLTLEGRDQGKPSGSGETPPSEP